MLANPNPGDRKRFKMATVFAGPEIAGAAQIHHPLSAQFGYTERFRSYSDKRVNGTMVASASINRGDPLFADTLSEESVNNVSFAETPDSLLDKLVHPRNAGNPQVYAQARARDFSTVTDVKTKCPFVGVCNSTTARSGLYNNPLGDMAINGVVRLIANFKTRVYAGQPLILTPYMPLYTGDKTGTVIGQPERLAAQAVVAGSDEFFPGNRDLCTNFNVFGVCAFSVNCAMDDFTVGTAYVFK